MAQAPEGTGANAAPRRERRGRGPKTRSAKGRQEIDASVKTNGTHRPRRIVLHTTESGDAAGLSDIKAVFAGWKSNGLGAHLVIDREGNMGKGAAFSQQTSHVAGHNNGSIGIEQIGFANKLSRREWLTQRGNQLDQTARMIAKASREYGIPIREDRENGIVRHSTLNPDSRSDPGPGYPMDYVLSLARQYAARG